MENPTEPQGHYGCSRQPRHNPLICEVITNHYTVGFHSSDINTWPQRTARPTLPRLFLNHWLSYLSPTFYISLEKRVIKSAEIAWARTSDAVRQNMCIPVQWDKQRHDERWKGSLLCIWQGKRDILAAPKHTRKGFSHGAASKARVHSFSTARVFLHIPILCFYSSQVLKSPVEKYSVSKVIKHFYIFHSLCRKIRKGGMSHERSDLLQWFVNKASICSSV